MSKKKFLFFIVILTAISLTSNAEKLSDHPSASTVKNYIKKHGAKKAIQTIMMSDKKRTYYLDRLSEGGEDWLEITEAIVPFSDGMWTSAILLGLGQALSKNPTGVMEVISRSKISVLNTKEICGDLPEEYQYEEAEAQDKDSLTKIILTKLGARKEAVEKINNQKLSGIRAHCSEEIEKGLTFWREKSKKD